MKQQVVTCGAYGHLTGILSEPNKGKSSKIAFLIWNTGVGTRVGHFRGHYELAELLASLGHSLLRFDLAGRGDSLQRKEKVDEQRRNSLDIVDAMDYLEAYHDYHSFVLLGVCSGAVDLHHVALVDYRVIGFAMVDTYIHPTPLFKLFYYLQRLKPMRIVHAIQRRVKQLVTRSKVPQDTFYGVYPSTDEIRAAWRDFMKRDLATLVIFTGGFNYLFSYARQFHDMLGGVKLNQRFHFHLLDRSDHVFTLIDQRLEFHQLLKAWIDECLPKSHELMETLEDLRLPEELIESIQSHAEERFVISLAQSKMFRSEELLAILQCYRKTLKDLPASESSIPTKTHTKLGRDHWGNPAYFHSVSNPDHKETWQLVMEGGHPEDHREPDFDDIIYGRDENGNPARFSRCKNTNQWFRLSPATKELSSSFNS